MTSTSDFKDELMAQFKRGEKQSRPHVEINAGELHRTLGGYPPKTGETHVMPSCCNAMWEAFDDARDVVVHQTESRHSPSLTIRYALPR